MVAARAVATVAMAKPDVGIAEGLARGLFQAHEGEVTRLSGSGGHRRGSLTVKLTVLS